MLGLLLLALTACGGEDTTEAGGVFRVAVVMPSAINDLAFSQSMYDALSAIQSERGADKFEFDYSENMFVVDDAATAIRDYATQGYNLVIAHGSQYGSSLVEIAPDFPETSFAWGTTVDTFVDQGVTNVFAYEARSEEGGYVMGVMAAKLTGWRIDIKSLLEAAGDAVHRLQSDVEFAAMAEIESENIPRVEVILAKKAEGRPVTPEEYQVLGQFVDRVERFMIRQRQEEK